MHCDLRELSRILFGITKSAWEAIPATFIPVFSTWANTELKRNVWLPKKKILWFAKTGRDSILRWEPVDHGTEWEIVYIDSTPRALVIQLEQWRHRMNEFLIRQKGSVTEAARRVSTEQWALHYEIFVFRSRCAYDNMHNRIDNIARAVHDSACLCLMLTASSWTYEATKTTARNNMPKLPTRWKIETSIFHIRCVLNTERRKNWSGAPCYC